MDPNYVITCPYCAAPNGEDEHRCQRCGRRIEESSSPVYYLRDATAPALSVVARPETEAPAPAPAPRTVQYQPPLFAHREIQPLVELPVHGRAPKRPRAPAPEAPAKPRKETPRSSGQHEFEFPIPSAAPAPRPVSSHIDCDAIVASPSLRIAAFFLDALVILAGFGLFTTAVRIYLGWIPAGRPALIAAGVSVALVAIIYKMLWWAANRDSLGQRGMGLSLISFDGRRPRRKQRMRRMLSGVLVSFAGMCVGLLWALIEEETLTWHDSISRTFPTQR